MKVRQLKELLSGVYVETTTFVPHWDLARGQIINKVSITESYSFIYRAVLN